MRISPSAVLDDRLHGKDLEWARDHLRRCESCRERVEEFREMMMRVGRLPSAPIASAAMDAAYAASIPDRARAGVGAQSPPHFDLPAPIPIGATPEPILETTPQPVRPEVTDARDLLGDLEREIFRDEPAQDHPTAMGSPPVGPAAPLVEPPLESELRQVPVDSRRDPEASAEPALPLLLATPAQAVDPAPEPVLAQSAAPPEAALLTDPATDSAPPSEEDPAARARRPDNAMRLAVGLGAAACVLLAAFLYEGGLLSRGTHKTAAVAPSTSVRATARSLPAASVAPSPNLTAAPAAPVLFRLGNGVSGGTVYRIRPGTAVPGYTRLVFDIRGSGLPAMVIAQPDSTHITITFSDTTGASVPVRGIRSSQVAAVEPGVQQGPDLTITVDLARPDRVTAFTLPAAGAYSPRLVVDLHTS